MRQNKEKSQGTEVGLLKYNIENPKLHASKAGFHFRYLKDETVSLRFSGNNRDTLHHPGEKFKFKNK